MVSSNSFIPELDGFRFLAISLVIISHIRGYSPLFGGGLVASVFSRVFNNGRNGVYLFFTISGFILALPFARYRLERSKPISLRSYFRRRLTRLEPPYVLMMLLRASALFFQTQTKLLPLMLHLLASLFYAHSLFFGKYPTISPPAWSLEIEIQFYLLAPLMASVFSISSGVFRRLLLFSVILTSGLAAALYIEPAGRLSFTVLNYFQYFAAGFLLCDLYLTGRDFCVRVPRIVWDLTGAVALIWILGSQNNWYTVILPLVTICFYLAGFFGRFTRNFFSLPIISITGGMCYSLYLTHASTLTVASHLISKTRLRSLPFILQTITIYLIYSFAVIAVGTLFFIAVERPCMNPAWPQQLSVRVRRRWNAVNDRAA